MPDQHDELWQGRACCELEFVKDDTICVSERYTVCQTDVAYYRDESLEEDEEFYGSNENVKPCQELGCNKKKLVYLLRCSAHVHTFQIYIFSSSFLLIHLFGVDFYVCSPCFTTVKKFRCRNALKF